MATSEIMIDSVPNERATIAIGGAAVAAAATIAVAFAGARSHDDSLADTWAIVLGIWAIATVFLGVRRSRETLWIWVGAAAFAGALALARDAFAGVAPYTACLFVLALPDGFNRRTRSTRALLIAATIAAVPFAVVIARDGGVPVLPIALESILLSAIAVSGFTLRCRAAGAVDRARMQWVGWGVVVAGAISLIVLLMHQLIAWPQGVGVPVIAGTTFVPASVMLGAVDRFALRVDRILVRTIEAGGLVTVVGAIYLVIVLGFGDNPTDASRRALGLSMTAAFVAALLFIPARNQLEEIANRRVYGDRRAPDEPLQTFGARMSRAIPLDELLLQLAESLKKSMRLTAAEVWTGTSGVLEQAAAVPYRESTRVKLRDEEIAVVSRAHTSGNAWIQVWLPEFLEQHPGRVMRIAPLVHSGELLGLIMCTRTTDDQPFTDEEDRVLTDLARQVAIALHNSALDTALQASLDELRVANEQLQASRARIVATGDQARRRIERNLHDGAQQHLVALAVKLGLARQLVESDPAALSGLLEELRADAQATLTELRELAHGIYPPLLMDRGLPEALRAAANRSVLPVDVDATVGRYPPDVEAAVYFCCLEAMQNAGKHAGETARITITVAATDDALSFAVADNGAGFEAGGAATRGHGFVNMTDRLGAIGGALEIESSPGGGTRVGGRIPLVVHVDDRPSQS